MNSKLECPLKYLSKGMIRVVLKSQFTAFDSLVVCKYFIDRDALKLKMTSLRAATCTIFDYRSELATYQISLLTNNSHFSDFFTIIFCQRRNSYRGLKRNLFSREETSSLFSPHLTTTIPESLAYHPSWSPNASTFPGYIAHTIHSCHNREVWRYGEVSTCESWSLDFPPAKTVN